MKLDVRFELRWLPGGEGAGQKMSASPLDRPEFAQLSSHPGARASFLEESFSRA